MAVSQLLFLASLSVISAQEDLHGKAFVFPQEGADAYVALNSSQEEPLQEFTVCLRSFTNLIKDYYALFSYATKDQNRDILIYRTDANRNAYYIVYIGGEDVYFRVPDFSLRWESSCITWESETGLTTLKIGGFVQARRVVQKGYSIGPSSVITLGDVYWHTSWGNAFSGEIKDVYMWNAAIPIRDLRMTAWDSLFPSPIINWRYLQYEMKGNVTLV